MAEWLVVYTQPGRETLAKAHITKLGSDVVLPLCTKGRPLFPRYLFATDPGDAIQIRYTPGVSDLLRVAGGDGAFIRLREDVVQALQAREGEDLTPPPVPLFVRGDSILIHGLIRARFEALRPNDRALVLVRILGGTRRSVVHLQDLAKAA